MPAGPTKPPWLRPCRILVRLGLLPEREIKRVALAICSLDPFSLINIVNAAMRELAISRVRSNTEVDVTICLVGIPGLN